MAVNDIPYLTANSLFIQLNQDLSWLMLQVEQQTASLYSKAKLISQKLLVWRTLKQLLSPTTPRSLWMTVVENLPLLKKTKHDFIVNFWFLAVINIASLYLAKLQ